MTNKDGNVHENAPNKNDEHQNLASKSLKSPAVSSGNRKRKPKRSRKVKFAEPLTEQRLYDRTLSPNTETVGKVEKTKAKHQNPLNELEPPLSLVAHLDIAAQKLNARPTTTKSQASSPQNMSPDEKDLSVKTTKSLGVKEYKSSLRKDKS